MSIYLWDPSEPLACVGKFLVYDSFRVTNTSFTVKLLDPLTSEVLNLFQHDTIEFVDGEYSLSSFRPDPLRFVFHKIIL